MKKEYNGILKIEVKKFKEYYLNDITEYDVERDGEINNIQYKICKTEENNKKLKININK